MSRSDLIGDALSMVKNAVMVKKEDVLLPFSRVVMRIMEIFKEEGLIEDFKEMQVGRYKKIKVYLKYKNNRSVIREIKRISKPGRRVYVDHKQIPQVLQGYGIAVISTSKGIVSDMKARDLGVGGEVICYVW